MVISEVFGDIAEVIAQMNPQQIIDLKARFEVMEAV